MTAEDGHRQLESGAAFMPSVSEKRLEKAARREKDHTAKFRLLACLARKRGCSICWIARELKTPYSTVRDWLLRMRDRGLGAGSTRGRRGEVSGFPSDAPHRAEVAEGEADEMRLRDRVVADGHGHQGGPEGV